MKAPDGLLLAPGRLTPGGAATTLANSRGGIGWCATLVGGGVYCWGLGQQAPPVATVLSSLAMSDAFSCGVRPDGTVSCWGRTCDAGSYWCKPVRNTDGSHDVALGQPAVSIATGAPLPCASFDGDGVCQAIIGSSVEGQSTSTGSAAGAWRAIDLDAPP